MYYLCRINSGIYTICAIYDFLIIMGYEKTIMIVDDKPIIAKMLMMNLKDYKCIYHSNPLKCIRWMQENGLPSLIITDLRMPSMSGRKFLQFLKEN